MHISIAQRFKPFSHRPGICCLVPGTAWQVEVFPILLRFKHLIKETSIEHVLPFEGPIVDFTVEQDLEKGYIRVFGKTPEGYMRYFIKEKDGGVLIEFDKLKPENGSFYAAPATGSPPLFQIKERLSLGLHKKQDWELLQRRQDCGEIFPIWLRLAQSAPHPHTTLSDCAAAKLLNACAEKIQQKDRNQITSSFLPLFLACFKGILCPRLHDGEFQGILPLEEKLSGSALPILIEGGKLIRSLFFQEIDGKIVLLPCLPTEFDAGRFTGILTAAGDDLDLEWSKKLLRRVVFRSHREQILHLELQKPIKNFRLRTHLKDHGRTAHRDEPIELSAHQTLYLDRFQK